MPKASWRKLGLGALILGAVCLLGWQLQPLGAGGTAAGGKTLQGKITDYLHEYDVLVFQATVDGKAWRYRLPIADNADIRLNGRAASVDDFREGMQANVTYRPIDGQNTIVALTGQGEAAQRTTAAKGKGKAGTEGDKQFGDVSVAYPTGRRDTSVLLVEADGPAKARVGQSYTYRVRLTNLTKDLVLEDVGLTQDLPKGVEVLSVELPDADKKERDQEKAKQKGQQAKQKGQQAKQKGQQAKQKGGEDRSAKQAQKLENYWLLKKLNPGESKVIRVNAVGHNTGPMSGCLRITYKPVLCVRTEFVKPELELVKKAPDVVDYCDPITFTYVVKNTGSAPAKDIVVRETLPDGLTVAGKKDIEGRPMLTAKVGDLGPGESRKFDVQALADKTGKFTSRAVAVSENDLRAYSETTTTTVHSINIQADIQGPDQAYVNQPATFRVNVKNTGEAPAQQTKLLLRFEDPSVRVVSAELADSKGKAKEDDGGLLWDLGTLKSGESRQVRVSAVGGSKGKIKLIANAAAVCARDTDKAKAKATEVVELQTIPALLLALVDQRDPVPVGETTTYVLSVLNQGTGPDQDVKIKLKLPNEAEFVDASGSTKAKQEGKIINFGPVEKLEAGQHLEWRIRVRAKREADVRTRAELSSRYLSNAVPSVEPTRFIGEGKKGSQ